MRISSEIIRKFFSCLIEFCTRLTSDLTQFPLKGTYTKVDNSCVEIKLCDSKWGDFFGILSKYRFTCLQWGKIFKNSFGCASYANLL